MACSSFSIEPSISSVEGRLNGSKIDLVLKDFDIFDVEIGDVVLPLSLNGTIQKPTLNFTAALQALLSEQSIKIGKAIGMRELKKELGIDSSATEPRDALISGLTNNVKEIGESPALQELIQQVVPSSQSTNQAITNRPIKKAVGNALIEQLEKNVKELEGNETVREALKSLFK
jgi:hypothetical protein